MSIEIKVPVLPESVADATVAQWHKQPGDSIRRDENLVDLETDKVVLEVPSPVDGVISKIIRDSGETVTSNELLGIIEEGIVEAAAPPAEATAQAKEPAVTATHDTGGSTTPATAAAALWVLIHDIVKPKSAVASTSATCTLQAKDRPRPPWSVGTCRCVRPHVAAMANASWPSRRSRSQRAALGATWSRARSTATCSNCRSVSVKGRLGRGCRVMRMPPGLGPRLRR